MPPQIFGTYSYFCFESRYPQQNNVIRQKSNTSSPKVLGWLYYCQRRNALCINSSHSIWKSELVSAAALPTVIYIHQIYFQSAWYIHF